MTLSGAVAVAGVYEHPTRWAPDKTEFQIMAESAKGALDDAGLTIGDVDALLATSMTMSGMGVVDLAEYLDLKPSYLDGTNIGGSSFVAHVAHAAAAIHAGLCEVALVLYGSTAASNAMAIGTGMGGERRDPNSSFASPYGMTTVGSYALVAQLHQQRFGTTSEQLAEIAVTMRHHASLNPAAKMRQPITVDDVLASRMISEPLHLLDCCIISDGGGAVVVTSAARARDLPKTPVLLLGCGEAVAHQEVGRPDLLTTAARQSSGAAFGMAGVVHDDIDLCMIYDSFTITVLATLENLGFCKLGDGGSFVSDGRIRLGGALPVNPDGGGLSSNHPGMRGIFLVIEAVKQLRGECDARQVGGARLACVHGTGGTLGVAHSGATLILGTSTVTELTHPRPYASWETRGWWEGAGRNELVLQRCTACGLVQHRPRANCAKCLTDTVEHVVASGRGTIHTFTVTHQNMASPFNAQLPYVLAYVELEEGPRVLTNIVGADPADVRIGQAVVADYAVTTRDDGEAFGVVRFRPA